jgi:uncharacterized membrane protein YeaQ/YmgE (transglycosylase-associated protein family)
MKTQIKTLALLAIILVLLPLSSSAEITGKAVTDQTFNSAKFAIEQKAIDVAKQVEIYLKTNPDKTLEDLKKDEYFTSIAVQQVGETGYTYVIVHETGILEFHPDQDIRDGSYNNFKERFPIIWGIIDETISSKNCIASSGFYDWEDINDVVREKFTYHQCVDVKTADGYTFFIGASTYLDEYKQDQTEKVQTFDEIAKQSIEQRAHDIGNQIGLYLKYNSNKTLEDLKQDPEFQNLAVQQVGKTGYTFLYDCNTMINHFHQKEKFIGLNYTSLKDDPGREDWWQATAPTQNCANDAKGVYAWKDPDGVFRDKYKYTKIIKIKTSDGIQFALGVSTYLDEYKTVEEESEYPAIENAFLVTLKNSEEIFNDLIEEDTEKIKVLMNEFMQQEQPKQLFKEKNREGLYDISLPTFEMNKEKDRITHFYYHTLEDTVFLRIHNKEMFGDTPTRETFRKSKATDSWGTGIELGKTAFALRVVHPYLQKNEKIGYIEFGEEIDHLFPEMVQRLDKKIEIAVAVRKEYIDETKWASVRSEKGLRNNYNDMKEFVVIESTDNSGFIISDLSEHEQDILIMELPKVFEIHQLPEKTYIYGGFPLYDVSGKKVGAILISQDITDFFQKENELTIGQLNWTQLLIGLIGALVFIFLITSLKNKKNKQFVFNFYGLIISSAIIIASYIIRLNTENEKLFILMERLTLSTSVFLLFFFMMLLISIKKKIEKRKWIYLAYILLAALAIFSLSTEFIAKSAEPGPGTYSKLNVENGSLYHLITALASILTLTSIYIIIKIKSRERKKLFYTFFCLIVLIGVNITYYLILDSSNPYLILVSPIVLITVMGYSLFKMNYLEYKKNTTMLLLGTTLIIIIGLFVFGSIQSNETLKQNEIQSRTNTNKEILNKNSHMISEEIDILLNELSILSEEVSYKEPGEIEVTNALTRFFKISGERTYASYRIDKSGIIANMYPVDETSLGFDISYQDHMKRDFDHKTTSC